MSALYSQYFWTWFILIYFRYLLWDKMNWMWSAWFSQLTVEIVQWFGSCAEGHPKFSSWLPFLLDELLTPVLPPLANSTGTPSVPEEIVRDILLMAVGCGAWPPHQKRTLGLWSLYLIKHSISVRAHGRMCRAHRSAASGSIPAVLAFICL